MVDTYSQMVYNKNKISTMGFSFRKSIKVGKFGKINISKSGIGASVGAKGVRVTKSATGRTSARVTIPKTGISWSKTLKK